MYIILYCTVYTVPTKRTLYCTVQHILYCIYCSNLTYIILYCTASVHILYLFNICCRVLFVDWFGGNGAASAQWLLNVGRHWALSLNKILVDLSFFFLEESIN